MGRTIHQVYNSTRLLLLLFSFLLSACGPVSNLTSLNTTTMKEDNSAASILLEPGVIKIQNEYYCKTYSELDSTSYFINKTFSSLYKRSLLSSEFSTISGKILTAHQNTCGNANERSYELCHWQEISKILLNEMSLYEKVNNNESYIKALYRSLFSREATAIEISAWSKSLESGVNKADVNLTFLLSDEFRKSAICYVPDKGLNLGVNGHPFTQASYKPDTGVTIEEQIALVKGLNAKWYRVGVDNLEEILKISIPAGVNLFPLIKAPNTLLVNDSNDEVYRKSFEYAKNLVSLYKDRLHIWEITNEQDIVALIKKGDPTPLEYLGNGCNKEGVWNCGGTAGIYTYDYNETRYQRIKSIISGISDGIHSADPSALRLVNFAGWLHTGFVQRLENDKVKYDIITVHWYSHQGDIACPDELYPCPAVPKYFNVIKKLNEITSNKPIWLTETNYKYDLTSLEDQEVKQKEYLVKVLERYKKNPSDYPFKVVMTYELLDEPYFGVTPESHYGLVQILVGGKGRIVGPLKAAYKAVAELFAP